MRKWREIRTPEGQRRSASERFARDTFNFEVASKIRITEMNGMRTRIGATL